MRLAQGDKLGPYEILGPLGAGGMGEVYRARDPRLAREVAIKVLPAAFTSDAERVRRFEHEARAAGSLNHPNLLATYDTGADGGTVYLVSELLEGESLRSRLQGGALPVRKAVDYAAQAARGLGAAHQRGIAHRDLKPENLFITVDGRVKILDFGLAKIIRPAASGGDAEAPTATVQTDPGVVWGTAGYMSPEQISGQAADQRSDIFSLGVILYEMIAGRRAFQRDTAVETQHAILKDDPAPLPATQLAQAPGVEQILRHCLEKSPGERFQSAQDLAFDLEALSGASTWSKPVEAQGAASAWRRMVVPGALLGCLLAGFGLSRLLLPVKSVDLSSQRYTPLATEMAAEIEPAWSPDGRTLAYTAFVDGIYQVFTRSLGTHISAQITHTETDSRSPQWSPDGSRIYYLGRVRGESGLAAVGAAGGTPELVIPGAVAFAVSPDGKTIAFARSSEGRNPTLWFQSLGGTPGERKKILPMDWGFFPPKLRYSPDGKLVGLMTNAAESRPEFWVIPIPEGTPRRVLEARSSPTVPVRPFFDWMPDSRHIVYAGVLESAALDHLLVADIRTGKVRMLTNGSGPEGQPAVSPAGDKIAFTTGALNSDLVEIPVDGSPTRILLATTRSEHCASWTPAGQLCYSRDIGPRQEIWMRNILDGSERPFLTPEVFRDAQTTRVSECAFSPDGRQVAYIRVAGGRYSIWLSAVAGGPPVPLTDESEAHLFPTWSPDGGWIAYLYRQGPRMGLAKASAGGGGRRISLKEPGTLVAYRPKWSPKGDWISWLDREGMSVVSPDGKSSMLLSRETEWWSNGFSKDGSALIGIRVGPRRRLLAVSIDLSSKKEKLISDLGPMSDTVHGFSLAPDGKSFVTSMVRAQGDIWILEGFR